MPYLPTSQYFRQKCKHDAHAERKVPVTIDICQQSQHQIIEVWSIRYR